MSNRGKGKKKQGAEPAPAVRPENYPTPELERQITTAIEVYRTKAVAGRDRESEAWRIVPAIEMMHRRGVINDDERDAAMKIRHHMDIALRASDQVSRYGDRAARGGTPISQQARDVLAPEEYRAHHFDCFQRACLATKCPNSLLEWYLRVIGEVPVAGQSKAPSVTDMGRALFGYSSDQQCAAAGTAYIKIVSWLFAVHFDFVGRGNSRLARR